MIGSAPQRLATVVAAGALVLVAAGCSSDTTDGAAASTTTVTSSASTPAPSAMPAPSATTATTAATSDADAGSTDYNTPLPVADFVDGKGYSFGTPSGQTQCRVTSTTLACQTKGHPHTVATDSLCGIYRGAEQGRADLFGYLEGGTLPCATVTQGEPYASPHTLQYRRSVTFRLSQGFTVTCTAAPRGLTCIDSDAHNGAGFFLSVDSFTQL